MLTNLCKTGVFSLFSCNFYDQFSHNVHTFVIACYDTPSKNPSLLQLPKVSNTFITLVFRWRKQNQEWLGHQLLGRRPLSLACMNICFKSGEGSTFNWIHFNASRRETRVSLSVSVDFLHELYKIFIPSSKNTVYNPSGFVDRKRWCDFLRLVNLVFFSNIYFWYWRQGIWIIASHWRECPVREKL